MKGPSEIVPDIKGTKDKVEEADLDLERSVTISQGLEKTLHCGLHNKCLQTNATL